MMKLSFIKKVFETVSEDWGCSFAERFVERWDCEEGSLKILRASANFVCQFSSNGKEYILRFNEERERKYSEVNGEIEFLRSIKSKNIVLPVISNRGNFVETYTTELGNFNVVVFEKIMGEQYEINEIDLTKIFDWGKALGKLHKKIKETLKTRKVNRNSLFFEVDDTYLKIDQEDDLLRKEYISLKKFIADLEIFESNYGVIHGDFELDNIIWNENGISIIDFDNSMFSWYVSDIAFALRDLFSCEKYVNLNHPKFFKFMEGYREENYINDTDLTYIPYFYRIHNYLTYHTLKRAMDIEFSTTNPNWLNNIILKLQAFCDNYYNELVKKQ